MIKNLFLFLFYVTFSFNLPKIKSEEFTIVVIPDTQFYTVSEKNLRIFNSKINWIMKNISDKNIVFISHVGDVIESPPRKDLYFFKLNKFCPIYRKINLIRTSKRWVGAELALKPLDDPNFNIPYSIIPGNHDYDCTGVKKSKRTTKTFLQYFGPKKYSEKNWYLGSDISGRNMAQQFKANGKSYIHIGLEWLAPDYAIEFAQKVITNNPKTPVIITTHSHLYTGNPAKLVPNFDGSNSIDYSGHNNAQQLYSKLVEPFPQVFMVLSGHILGDGFLQTKTYLGQNVTQILSNYAKDPKGGNGWLKLLKFNPDSSELKVQIFSPTYNRNSKGINRAKDKTYNKTFYKDINSLHNFLETHVIKHFRNEQNINSEKVYKGTVDLMIKNSSKNNIYNNKNIIIENKNIISQGLLKFDDLIGFSDHQIPPNKKIRKAILTLTAEGKKKNIENIYVYKIVENWDQNTNGDDLNNLIQNQLEVNNPSFVINQNRINGTINFDVTQTVQDWINGSSNNGWLFSGGKGSFWNFRSSDWDGIAERPMLTIIYKD